MQKRINLPRAKGHLIKYLLLYNNPQRSKHLIAIIYIYKLNTTFIMSNYLEKN